VSAPVDHERGLPRRGDGGAGASSGSRGRHSRAPLALAVGWATLFLIGTDLFVVSPLLPLISHQFRISAGAAGLMVTAFSISYVIGTPGLGALADRLGRRHVLVAGLGAFAVANLLTSAAPWFSALLLSRLLAGLSAAAISPSVYALVGQAAPAQRRGARLAIVGSGLLVALSTAAPIGAAASELVGWRALFATLSALALLLLVVNRLVWPPSASTSARGQLRLGLMTKLRAVGVTALWGYAVYTMYTYLGTGIRQVQGLSEGLAAVAFGVYGTGAIVGSLLGGRLADRHGPRWVTALSLSGLTIGEALVAMVLPVSGVLIPALGLFAIVAYAYFPSYQTWLVASHPRVSGSLLAWNNSALYTGIALGSAIGAPVMAAAGFRAIPLAGAVGGLIASIGVRYRMIGADVGDSW
jgi:predicted MFS family arabinose efflux permease